MPASSQSFITVLVLPLILTFIYSGLEQTFPCIPVFDPATFLWKAFLNQEEKLLPCVFLLFVPKVIQIPLSYRQLLIPVVFLPAFFR